MSTRHEHMRRFCVYFSLDTNTLNAFICNNIFNMAAHIGAQLSETSNTFIQTVFAARCVQPLIDLYESSEWLKLKILSTITFQLF